VADKALRVSGVGLLEHAGTLDLGGSSAAEVNIGWGVETDAGMVVLVVVPLEEPSAESAAILDCVKRAKTNRRFGGRRTCVMPVRLPETAVRHPPKSRECGIDVG
jgi:hypothetical protein